MRAEQIKQVLMKLAAGPWGKAAVMAFDLDEIAELLERFSRAYHVEARLALAQGIAECHFGMNPAAKRSRATRNIFNVGNVDNGRNRSFRSYAAGIETYFQLMAREYCYRDEGSIVTAEMMIKHDFNRPRGGRYATAPSYTQTIAKLVKKIDGCIK